jgi:hypothetical protein
LEFPVFVTVTSNELVLFTVILPKLKLVGFAASRKLGAAPTPLREITNGEFGASLIREMLPDADPATVGVNNALKVAVLPTAIVKGVVRPLRLNPEPDILACEIVTLVVPLLESVTTCELFLAIVTVPKLIVEGLTFSPG